MVFGGWRSERRRPPEVDFVELRGIEPLTSALQKRRTVADHPEWPVHADLASALNDSYVPERRVFAVIMTIIGQLAADVSARINLNYQVVADHGPPRNGG
jgi:hypothetical protein